MKRTLLFIAMLLTFAVAKAQPVYWVFLADKAGTTFDPYSYFDAKAIERYAECGANLYDLTNYPLTQSYVDGVNALATEEVGVSRWLNAMGVVATPEQADAISRLPYVVRVQRIEGDMQVARISEYSEDLAPSEGASTTLSDQLLRMQGQLFREKGIDGSGIRIAVFDGGFPKVNTHEAFRHLRENNRILKTWNFPNHKENVYGWNSHGTMTLSCIAGRKSGLDLGLATGAEFLLARTEVEAEPFKEEVWWMQAVEWADRNGANIISSSLGYGKDRYYTKDMDGKSYVAKAANLAARKGMLVVNSAGNEGDDRTWQYIITPSDADSALCVGGISHSLTAYEHISFSSFGPAANGKQKPNVCAFAHTWAASPKNDNTYEMVYGTSFSCPLVAGFAACAWQASKGKSNMELFDLIQRSADLYPYCDYAFGYGVPQASFFVSGKTANSDKPVFRFEPQGPSAVSVRFVCADSNVHIFYKDVADDGSIRTYGKRTFESVDTTMSLDFQGGSHLVVFCKGQMSDYRFEQPTPVADKQNWVSTRSGDPESQVNEYDNLVRAPALDIAREGHAEWDMYFMLGVPVSFGSDELSARFWSPAKRVGGRWQYHFSKAYGIGLGVEYGHVAYRYNGRQANTLEQNMSVGGIISQANKISHRRLYTGEWSAECFQRVRIVPAGLLHKGLHWDLGAYITYLAGSRYQLTFKNQSDPVANKRSIELYNLKMLDSYRWQWGLTTRVTYDMIGLYARYHMGCFGPGADNAAVTLPPLEVGVQILF